MKLYETYKDEAMLQELGQRLERCRIDAGLTQAALAKEAGIGKRTLERLEAGDSTQLKNLLRVLRVLGLLEAFDAAIPEARVRPADVVKRQGVARKRVRGTPEPSSKPWVWGDEK